MTLFPTSLISSNETRIASEGLKVLLSFFLLGKLIRDTSNLRLHLNAHGSTNDEKTKIQKDVYIKVTFKFRLMLTKIIWLVSQTHNKCACMRACVLVNFIKVGHQLHTSRMTLKIS